MKLQRSPVEYCRWYEHNAWKLAKSLNDFMFGYPVHLAKRSSKGGCE